MGLNLIIETLDGKAHPAWDSGRFAGDRDVSAIIAANGGAIEHPASDDYDPWKHGDDVHFRPGDFDALAAAPWPDFNEARWATLQRILRDEPEYWLRLSY